MDSPLASAAVGAGVAVATTVISPGAAGLVAILGPTFDVLRKVTGEVSEQREAAAYAEFIAALGELEHYDPQEARNRFEALIAESPANRRKLHDAFLSTLLARSEAAHYYIARLLIVAMRGQFSEAFCKRAGWFLERCEDDDIQVLQAALAKTKEIRANTAPDRLATTGIEWEGEDDGLTVDTNPDGQERRVTVAHSGFPPERYADVVALVGESRLGIAKQIRTTVYFPFTYPSLDGLIWLFRA